MMAPISKHGPLVKFLGALILTAMVYFFFVFYGGNRRPSGRKSTNATEIAGIVARFPSGTTLYPQEWNDFIECRHPDAHLDSYRQRCYELDPLVNSPGAQDTKALAELRGMVGELRRLPTPG
jgi:hypothetical protein